MKTLVRILLIVFGAGSIGHASALPVHPMHRPHHPHHVKATHHKKKHKVRVISAAEHR